MKKKIKIGVDFDGVVAYNPFRIIRAPIALVKRNVFGIKKLKFFVPQTPLERFIWTVVHESSFFPAIGVERLKELSKRDDVELHLITARFAFLEQNLFTWLTRHALKDIFTGIHINHENRQPHVHKEDLVNSLKLDYFIEDNLDIVTHLVSRTPTRVLWIYNILDRLTPYVYKYPYLEKALEEIMRQHNRTGH